MEILPAGTTVPIPGGASRTLAISEVLQRFPTETRISYQCIVAPLSKRDTGNNPDRNQVTYPGAWLKLHSPKATPATSAKNIRACSLPVALQLWQSRNELHCGSDRFQILVDVTIENATRGMIGDPLGNLAKGRLIENLGCRRMPERMEGQRPH